MESSPADLEGLFRALCEQDVSSRTRPTGEGEGPTGEGGGTRAERARRAVTAPAARACGRAA